MIALIGLTFIFFSCKNQATQPPPPSGPDTTSNNFTWQTFTFGNGNAGSCMLNDIAIINDSLAYAVGAIYTNDSTTGQPDPQPYNLATWDGKVWKLQKLPYNYQGQLLYHPIQCVFALNANDIWFAGNGVEHWDGHKFSNIDEVNSVYGPYLLQKIWASSDNDIYMVGDGGTIVHYSGGSWTKIESGTNLQFLDIYGSGGQVLTVCSQNYPLGEGIFNISGNTATQVSSNPLGQYELFSVWFVPGQHYYVVGSGIYEKNSLSDSSWRNSPTEFTHYGSSEVRGSGLNDVFVVGAFGEFLHWNGASWKSFIAETGLASGSYGSVAVKGNLVVAVGYNSPQAVITMGRRQ